MNPQALQRVVVRMLYDPRLVETVHSGDPVDGLDAAGRAHLLRIDRRAWATDPYRRSRTLQALIEELPVSAALAGIESLYAFFSSEIFHRAVQERCALVLAFARWVEPQVGDIARLEGAIARARQRSPQGGPGLTLARGVAAVSLPEGLLQWWQAATGTLGTAPVCRLLEGPVNLEPPPTGPSIEHCLLERGAEGGIQLGGGSESLVKLLCAAETPRTPAQLEARAVELGATPTEALGVIQRLIDEGLIVRS